MSILFLRLLLPLFLVYFSGGSSNASISTPSTVTIAADLIGRRLSEGTDYGYFPPDWSWTIEPGEISNLRVLNKTVSKDYCTLEVSMIFKSKFCPTRYRAIVQMDYCLVKNRWEVFLVKSKGVNVVKTGKYLDCISTKIDDDGWGGVSCLKIKNNIDSSLLVGGVYRTYYSHEWHKFSVIIDGLTVMGVGGTFERGSVVDYRIHFVEPY